MTPGPVDLGSALAAICGVAAILARFVPPPPAGAGPWLRLSFWLLTELAQNRGWAENKAGPKVPG